MRNKSWHSIDRHVVQKLTVFCATGFPLPPATKQEQLEFELSRLAQNNRLTSPEPQETKPNVKEEQLLRELEVLAAGGGTVPPEERLPRGRSPAVKLDPAAAVQMKQEPPATSTGDENERRSRSVKEEQLELEVARLARSMRSTPAAAPSVKPEPGLPGSVPPDSRSTAESTTVGPSEGPLVGVKSEPGSATPNPLKRLRDGQNQIGKTKHTLYRK